MRAGLAFSLVLHIALLVWGFVLFASPKPFAPMPPDAITVELVPAAAAQEAALEEKSAGAAEADVTEGKQDAAPAARTRTAAAAADLPVPQSSGGLRGSVSAAAPSQSTSGQGREQSEAQQTLPAASLLVYEATIPAVADVPLVSSTTPNATGGYDAPANATASLSADDIAALRAHLQRCWKLPPDIADAPKLRVVLRVSLRPNGALSGTPMLIEAPASAKGPALVSAAMKALRECQPYAFLPAAKYQEWKLLDLSFSPLGLAG